MRTLPIAMMAGTVWVSSVSLPPLRDETARGWARYIQATEQRIDRETTGTGGFLALSQSADAKSDRRDLLTGAVVIHRAAARDSDGRDIDVPSSLVHDWRGAVLLRGVRLTALLAKLQSDAPDTGQVDVLRASVLTRGPDTMTVFLKVRRTKFVTVVYDTEHEVRFRRLGPDRAVSTSVATKIAEVTDAGTTSERELPPGEDHGFLWRWNAYWRYEQVDEGVIAECESVSLSRDVPFGFGTVIGPLVESTARESMARTLTSLRTYFE